MIKLVKQTLLLVILLTGVVSFAQVGINTDNSNPDPSSMLDVKSTDKGLLIPRMDSAQRVAIASPATGLMVYQTDGPSGFYFNDGSTWNLIGGSDDDWLFNGSEIYRSGNVGIGTNNPAFPIDILGTGGERLRAFSQDGYFAGLLSKNSTREFFAGVQADFETNNTTSGYHIYDNTAGARRMVIDELGNMGVGASNPTAKLDVRGNNIDDGVIISVGNSDESHKLMLFGGRQNDPNPFVQWKDGDPLRFATDASGFTEHMRITGNGDVGIGTSSPEEKLHVEGALKIVDGTQGMGKVLVSDSTGVTSWVNLSDVINTSDTTQPIPIQYHGSQIYVHPTDNGSDVDWVTASANCDALVAFTFDDWYLPTRLELDAIYKQSYLITGLSQTAFVKYWSSTETDVSNAFSQRLDYGGPDPDAKTESTGHNCRCIRKN